MLLNLLSHYALSGVWDIRDGNSPDTVGKESLLRSVCFLTSLPGEQWPRGPFSVLSISPLCLCDNVLSLMSPPLQGRWHSLFTSPTNLEAWCYPGPYPLPVSYTGVEILLRFPPYLPVAVKCPHCPLPSSSLSPSASLPLPASPHLTQLLLGLTWMPDCQRMAAPCVQTGESLPLASQLHRATGPQGSLISPAAMARARVLHSTSRKSPFLPELEVTSVHPPVLRRIGNNPFRSLCLHLFIL